MYIPQPRLVMFASKVFAVVAVLLFGQIAAVSAAVMVPNQQAIKIDKVDVVADVTKVHYRSRRGIRIYFGRGYRSHRHYRRHYRHRRHYGHRRSYRSRGYRIRHHRHRRWRRIRRHRHRHWRRFRYW